MTSPRWANTPSRCGGAPGTRVSSGKLTTSEAESAGMANQLWPQAKTRWDWRCSDMTAQASTQGALRGLRDAPGASRPAGRLLPCLPGEVHAAVGGPGGFVVAVHGRLVLTVAHGVQLPGGHAQVGQVLLHRRRAPVGELEVVLLGAALVRVALEHHPPLDRLEA